MSATRRSSSSRPLGRVILKITKPRLSAGFFFVAQTALRPTHPTPNVRPKQRCYFTLLSLVKPGCLLDKPFHRRSRNGYSCATEVIAEDIETGAARFYDADGRPPCV